MGGIFLDFRSWLKENSSIKGDLGDRRWRFSSHLGDRPNRCPFFASLTELVEIRENTTINLCCVESYSNPRASSQKARVLVLGLYCSNYSIPCAYSSGNRNYSGASGFSRAKGRVWGSSEGRKYSSINRKNKAEASQWIQTAM